MKAAEAKENVAWDWMRPEAATIQREATVEEAISRMQRLSIHHLVVMDGKNYCGMLDAWDCAGVWDPDTQVCELMQTGVAPVEESTEIGEVVARMVDAGLTALPLKRNQEVRSVITTTDLMRLLAAELSQRGEVARLWDRGKDFLARPIVQSLVNLLGNAGL